MPFKGKKRWRSNAFLAREMGAIGINISPTLRHGTVVSEFQSVRRIRWNIEQREVEESQPFDRSITGPLVKGSLLSAKGHK